jgi:hypothetical protein
MAWQLPLRSRHEWQFLYPFHRHPPEPAVTLAISRACLLYGDFRNVLRPAARCIAHLIFAAVTIVYFRHTTERATCDHLVQNDKNVFLCNVSDEQILCRKLPSINMLCGSIKMRSSAFLIKGSSVQIVPGSPFYIKRFGLCLHLNKHRSMRLLITRNATPGAKYCNEYTVEPTALEKSKGLNAAIIRHRRWRPH